MGMQRYQKAAERVKQLRAEMVAAAKEAFDEGSKALFDAHPDLQSFSWTQYTPYFNDGEPCEFGVNAEYDMTVNGEKDVYPATPLMKAAADFVTAFADEDMEAMFGDHVEVTVTRRGVETEEYEHD